nr:radical SAM protein [uncultured Methylophaga sp.]
MESNKTDQANHQVLIVDLNNFSRYPTLSVGYLSSILKNNGAEVDVLSPLFFGVHGFPRNVKEPRGYHYLKFLNHIGATSENRFLKFLYDKIKNVRKKDKSILQRTIVSAFQEQIKNTKPDIVLISAYTMYFDMTSVIAGICDDHNIPLIVGGNSFVIPEIAQKWSVIRGVTAVFAGEPEAILNRMVDDVLLGNDISHYQGVYEDRGQGNIAKPLESLDSIPYPTFDAFPWRSYPNRIIPIMTGRGCEWGRCSFCSDVLTSAGRNYRSRSLDNVISEMKYQRSRHQADLFVLLDLKLNSDLDVWKGLAERISHELPDIKWTASVHVDSRTDNGLSYADLKKASEAGLVRITTGLESGSQEVLNSMLKGTKLKRVSEFIKTAHAVGLSVRLTCIIGEGNEQADDIKKTTNFLREHEPYIERVVINRFAYIPGTPAFYFQMAPEKAYKNIKLGELDLESGLLKHSNSRYMELKHRIAVFGLLRVANTINRKPLIEKATEFEGAF